MMSMKIDPNVGYQPFLETVKEAFFPDGVNPTVGEISLFHDFERVNGHNVNICEGLDEFTLNRYIEKKMISGSVRLYLMLSNEAGGDDQTETDPDYLPDLEMVDSHTTSSHMATSPSGEVLIRVLLVGHHHHYLR